MLHKINTFSNCKNRKVLADFSGGNVTSDGGVLLLKQIDERINLTSNVIKSLPRDHRRKKSVRHSMSSMLKQRVYSIALGYEDLNDHNDLRNDFALQTALNRIEPLASSPTLCRFENMASREANSVIHEVLFQNFISSFKKPPKKLILDFDSTDDRVHGSQEKRFFHGYYDHYCFLPLYVFCGQQLLVAYLRPSKIDGAKHALAILSILVRELRKTWPGVKIIFRGDSGFCRHRLLSWCERNNVDYIVGIARNSCLLEISQSHIENAKRRFELKREKQRHFGLIQYGAKTWSKERSVIVKAEHTAKGANTRFVVTNLKAHPHFLYDRVYCARGEMENRIKEQQLDLFADRTSCHAWDANQFRLLLSSLAYVLLEELRRVGLKGTELAKAQCGTIRLKLLKIGAVVTRNTRRIRFFLSSSYPLKNIFTHVVTIYSTA
ncbi:IS1380 family transposase [Candidatus Riflebacteria bacterium]